VLSQVVLSFGIAFALVPLVRATSDAALMGESRNALGIRIAAWAAVAVVVALNLALIWLTVTGA
jgi:manganese transport protein